MTKGTILYCITQPHNTKRGTNFLFDYCCVGYDYYQWYRDNWYNVGPGRPWLKATRAENKKKKSHIETWLLSNQQRTIYYSCLTIRGLSWFFFLPFLLPTNPSQPLFFFFFFFFFFFLPVLTKGSIWACDNPCDNCMDWLDVTSNKHADNENKVH